MDAVIVFFCWSQEFLKFISICHRWVYSILNYIENADFEKTFISFSQQNQTLQ